MNQVQMRLLVNYISNMIIKYTGFTPQSQIINNHAFIRWDDKYIKIYEVMDGYTFEYDSGYDIQYYTFTEGKLYPYVYELLSHILSS
ncbi:MAG TPA: hypothetical protein VLG50_05100 [Candidatus Saccharimonadales bacterium]|nr:hypothetical protein [Candidatus Saccharimonadales bacterium]